MSINELIEPIAIDKDSLLKEMQKHLERQRQVCELKWEKAMEIEDTGGNELSINKKTKKDNTDLKEYNEQVKALGITIQRILQIQNSKLPVGTEETDDVGDEELV